MVKEKILTDIEEIRRLGIKELTICILKENVNINNINLKKMSVFSQEVDESQTLIIIEK